MRWSINSAEDPVKKILLFKELRGISIKHLGTVKGGVEDTESAEGKTWAEALENYTLREVNGSFNADRQMDVNDEYRSYFEETWPRFSETAQEKLQQIYADL